MSQEKQKSKKLELVCADCGRPRKSASVTGWIFGGSINTCNCVSMARGRLDTSIAVAATSLEDELEKRSRTRRRKEPDLFLASRYKIGELVGVGGMGAVYKAHYTQLAKTFAIKILQQELAADPTALRRFEREAGAVGQLSHPNIVAVYEFGMTQDASPYLVMDYLDGEGLDARLRSEVYLSGETVADLFIQVADALAHAHNKSIVHRDIKPSNMILLKDENDNDLVKLVDFGIAKIMPEGDKTTLGTTQTGELIGSPWYMSPEQCAGKTIDGRSDIYSAGCVMYEAITGKPPFCGDNLVQIILHHVNEPSPRPRDKHPSLEIHEDLEYIVLRCLEKNPEDRYQNADSLKQDLELFRAGVPIKKIVSKNRDFSSTQKLSRLGLKANLLLGLSTVLLLSGIVISTLFITDGFGLIGLSGGANGDSVSRWTELVKIGQESFDQGEYKSASHSLKEALSLAEKMQTKPEYLRTSLNHMRDLSVVEKNTSETNFIDARIAGLNSADDEQLKSIERQLDEAINDDTKDRDYYNDLANSANDSLASLIEAGRYEPADRLLTKAFELTEKKVGARSQVMTRCLHNRAYLDHDLGDYKKALAGYEKALALERDVFGKQHVIIASTQLRLARLRLQLGIADQQTKDYLNDALSIYRNLQGPYSDNVGLSRYHLALYYAQRLQNDRSANELNSALTVFRNQKPPNLKYIARCLSLLGDIESSAEKYKEALAIFETEPIVDYPQLISVLLSYGRNRLSDKPEFGVSLLKRADALTEHLGPSNRDLMKFQIAFALAEGYRNSNQFALSRDTLSGALSLSKKLYGLDSPETLLVKTKLATLYEDYKENGRAGDLYEQCQKIVDQHKGDPAYEQAARELTLRYKQFQKKSDAIRVE